MSNTIKSQLQLTIETTEVMDRLLNDAYNKLRNKFGTLVVTEHPEVITDYVRAGAQVYASLQAVEAAKEVVVFSMAEAKKLED